MPVPVEGLWLRDVFAFDSMLVERRGDSYALQSKDAEDEVNSLSPVDRKLQPWKNRELEFNRTGQPRAISIVVFFHRLRTENAFLPNISEEEIALFSVPVLPEDFSGDGAGNRDDQSIFGAPFAVDAGAALFKPHLRSPRLADSYLSPAHKPQISLEAIGRVKTDLDAEDISEVFVPVEEITFDLLTRLASSRETTEGHQNDHDKTQRSPVHRIPPLFGKSLTQEEAKSNSLIISERRPQSV